MKKIFLHLLLFFGLVVQGQNYTMPTSGHTTYTTCSGVFTDSGGQTNNYSNNQNSIITFCPSTSGNKIRLEFQQFLLEAADMNSCYDYIEIYQGSVATGTPDIICGAINNLVLQSTENDGCITIRFVSNDSVNMAGWIANISCVETNCTPPVARFTTSNDLICNNTADNNTNDSITFNASSSTTSTGSISQYIWDFGDGNTRTSTTPVTTHTFANPGIYNVSLRVVNSSGCSSTMPAINKLFHTNAPSFEGSTISSQTIACGQVVSLVGVAKSQTIVSSPPRIIAGITNLPDGKGTVYESTLDFSSMFPQGMAITSECFPQVSLDLEHSYTGDLQIELVAPNGTAIRLFNQQGGSNHFGTCSTIDSDGIPGCPLTYTFVHSGGTPIHNGVLSNITSNCSGYSGNCENASYYISQTFNSHENFNSLVGAPIAGLWKIRITDQLWQDDGFLFSWSLNFPQSCYANVEQYTPKITDLVWNGPNLPNYSNTNIDVTNPGPGCPDGLTCEGNQISNNLTVGPFNTPGTYAYTLTATDEFGCRYTRTHSVIVTSPTITAFSYTPNILCTDNGPISPSLTTDSPSGTFSSTPNGLSLNSSTGVITPSESTPGSYTVSYTTTCGNISRATNVTIEQKLIPTFTQIPAICIGENFILPTTSTQGIVGSWSPAINTASTTTYTFTPNANQCADSTTMTVQVKPKPVVVASPASEAFCSGSATNIVLSSETLNTTYSWTVVQNGVSGAVAGSGNTISQRLTATTSQIGTVTYIITPMANGCVGEPIEVEVTVNPIPVVVATPNTEVLCSGSTTNIILSSETLNTTYSWTVVQNGVSGAVAGSGNTISQTLTTTTSQIGTVTYIITPTANGCVGEPIEVVVTINPIPVVVATPASEVFCSGSTTNIILSSETLNTTYSWTVVQNGVSGAVAGSGNTISQTLTATTAQIGTVTYIITPTANSCVGEPIEVVVTVNPIPVVVATPASETFCSGSTTNIVLSSETLNTTYSWTVVQNGVSGAVAGSGNTISQTLTATTPQIGTVTYIITPTANGCVGEPIEVVVTINPIPVVVTTPASEAFCSGSATNIILSSETLNTTYSWTVVQNGVSGAVAGSGNTISQTLTTTTPQIGTVTYIITPTANDCVGEPIEVMVTVNPIPVVVATPNTEVLCSGSTTNILLSSETLNTTYSWTVVQNGVSGAVAGSGNTISQMLTATTPQIGTVTYIITPTANGCVGEPIEVVVTVNPIPVVVATPASEAFCSGNTTNIVLSSETLNTTYSWTVVQNGVSGAVAGSGNTISQTLTTTTPQIGTVTYIITPTANGCAGEPIEVVVTVNPIPVVVATPNTEVLCSGSTTNLVLSSETLNTTYSWTVVQNGVSGAVAGSGSTISQTLTATTAQIGTVTYIITPTANGCVGVPIEVVVTVNPIPVAVATPASETFCSGSTTNIVLSSETLNTTYSWTVVQNGVSGAVAGSGNTISQTLTATTAQIGTVTYIITPTANSCVGEPIEVVVTVNPIPVVVATPNTEVLCSGSTTNLVLSSETLNTTYSWTVVQNGVSGAVAGSGNTISQTLTATTSQIGTVTYIITPTANGCVGAPIEVVVTVNPIPVVVATPASEVFCSGSQTNIVLSSETLNTTYSWTVVQNGVSGAVAGSGNTISQTLTATTAQIGTVTYIITPTANGCVGELIEVVVTVNPIPVVVATPATLNLCSDDVSNIVLTSETLNTTYSWTVIQNGVSGALAGSGSTISQTLTATTAQIGTVTYIITPTANGCVGESTEVTLFITPYVVPEFEPVTAICAGETLQALPTRSLNGIDGTWSPALNNMETTTYTFTPHVQNTGTVCQSQTSLTIVVHPIPVVQASVVDSALCSGETTSISLTSQVPGTQFSYTVVSSNVSGAEGGVGNAINQTLLNTTLQEGNVVYAITPIANNCQGETIYVEVKVNPNPELHIAVSSLSICSNEELSASFSSNVPGTTYSWTVLASNVNGALSGSGDELTQTLTTTGLGGTVTYIVTPMFNGCSGIAQEFTVEVKPRPEVFAPSSLTICSGEYAQINLSASHPDVTYSYTVQQDNVVGGFSGTGSLIDQMLETLTEQVGYVTYYITPSLNGCEGETISVRVRVNPVKYIDLADGYICYDSKTGLAISNHAIQTGLSASQYSFVWYQDQEILAGEIGNSLTVNEAGIYHVVATNLNTGCVSESGFSVISESYSAESVQAFVSNSFTHGAITVVVTGSGNYQYQLNGGAFQSSNIFTNVLPGTHRIVVIDSEGCTHEELEVHILSFMNFFTPNGDGIHDTWNIWSLSDQADAEIYIFDRHGKLIKQISPSGEGWDGTYNGVAVPSTDYWFSVTYRDGIHQEIKTYKSHFSLKR